MKPRTILLVSIFLIGVGVAGLPTWIERSRPAARAEAPVDFSRDIRPLLARNCTTCHGGVKQAGGISFIFREDVLGSGESGETVVVPGDPDASSLIRRIRSTDPAEKMPPPREHPQGLAPGQIALLERWVREGAVWEEHWAFTPPRPQALPPVTETTWPKNGLDTLVLARLETENLAPNPAASPHQWLRRVSLDLTGLPPTLEEWLDFKSAAEADGEAAMAAVVDRLLASPHYGERWASVWLDLARYSDTLGFEKDPHRDIWPYRDWVIQAFTQDMPYDQFTAKQLAGDLLPNPEPGDFIATAFHRNTQTNDEGGTDDEEYRMEAVMDRVGTTWATWQGTTFTCVQCHAHPYDPIPHRDYYRFTALFNNSEDVDLTSDFPRTKVARDPGQQAEAQRLERSIQVLRGKINEEAYAESQKITAWRSFVPETARSSGPRGTLAVDNTGLITTGGTHPNQVVFTLSGPAASFGAIRLDTFPNQEDPKEWHGFGAVASKLEAEIVAPDGSRRTVTFREVVADYLAGPFDPNDSLRDGPPGFGEYPMTKKTRQAVFVPDEPIHARDSESLEIRLHQQATSNAGQMACHLTRFRLSLTDDPRLIDFTATPQRQARWTEWRNKRSAYQAINGLTIPTMRERSKSARRDTRVFLRGNRLTLDEQVSPGVPELFGGTAGDVPMDRLSMAQWLTGDANPLTARVLANRLWAEFFGIGIVETQEDFGSAGLPPSHQPLLDYLALRLKDRHRWHIKPFLRELALSATYRQSAVATLENHARDSKNQLLARGPRQRLTAEMVRDQALLVSGLLSRKLFGEPVFPPQPEGIWNSVYSGATWKTSEGEDRYRRALYTYRKRTSGYPALLTFDAPTGDICTTRRIPTNTPLQALNTLNDPAQIEFAQALAERMARADADPAKQLHHGFFLLTLEDPGDDALNTLTSLYADALAVFEGGEADATLLAPGPAQAALTLVANTLLNMDAVLIR